MKLRRDNTFQVEGPTKPPPHNPGRGPRGWRGALMGMGFDAGSRALSPRDREEPDPAFPNWDLFYGAFLGAEAHERREEQDAETEARIRDEQAELEFPMDEISGWGDVLTDVDGVEVRRNKVSDPEGLRARVPEVITGHSPEHPVRYGLAYQCVEFVKRYYALVFGHDTGYGNANEYLEGDRGDLETHRKENGAFPCRPEKGDLMVDNSGGFGHVGIVKCVSGGTMVVAQQNTSEPEVTSSVTRVRSGQWEISGGWDGFRRKGGGTPSPPEREPDPSVDPELVNPYVPGIPSGGAQTYRVRSGDSLGTIAYRFNVPGGYMELARFNNIANPDVISVGQTINIPG